MLPVSTSAFCSHSLLCSGHYFQSQIYVVFLCSTRTILGASIWRQKSIGSSTTRSQRNQLSASDPDIRYWIALRRCVWRGAISSIVPSRPYLPLASIWTKISWHSEWRHTQPCVYDQRLALDWVKEILHHFGGDCNRVTVGGESPGPAITLHQITAFGGTQLAPFQQAYLSSPAFNPNPYDWLQEQTYNNFLGYANVSSLAELRAASSETIIRANELLVYNSTFGASGGIGPAVDGNIVPQLPALLLAQSRRAKNVRTIFTGHNSNEGFIFVDPAV